MKKENNNCKHNFKLVSTDWQYDLRVASTSYFRFLMCLSQTKGDKK